MIDIDKLISEAIKAKNQPEIRAYRNLKSAILLFKTAKNAKPYDEAAEIQIIKKMISQGQDAQKQYLEAHREDLAQTEGEELLVLEKLIPAAPTASEVQNFYMDYRANKNFDSQFPKISKKEMGLVIKDIKAALPSADGKLISEVVKQYVE